MTKQNFVNTFLPAALKAVAGTSFFAVVEIAEAAVESRWGESELTQKGNNLFGVKAYPQYWTGEVITMHTKEYDKQGHPFFIDADFKKYPTAIDSFTDHVKVLQGKRYRAAGVGSETSPEDEISDIAKAGYSTSDSYAKLISTIIEELRPLMPVDTSYPDPKNPFFNPENFA